ncbi:Glycosyltransferase involved in cell wall bisynthesis [Roseomonas rosea]|uniref:Glycosyltransferase involved in cell wall bisynthesis n=1 Tax=Muricoccus roseus TaxID=198092 RepID=A0A1M6EX42_9PROT|nr:glycosyltransferase family 4 protein [Roseomonas rosea]SHI89986.1 Glycosyltransferase involved in cell wall bisynthesis [Roseomonas rosea]
MARTTRTRRLLVLFPGERFGGAEAHTLRITDAAAQAGMQVTLAAAPALHPSLAAPGRSLLDLPVAWRRGLPATARQAQAEAVRAALAEAKPDVVLLPLPWPDQAGGAFEALAESGTPTLVVSHLAPHGEEPPPGLDEEALAAAHAMRADWVAVSAPTAFRLERFLGLAAGRVATIRNGVDAPPEMDRDAWRAALRKRLGLPGDALVALFLGRLDAAKGADRLPFLAEAFARRSGGVIAAAGTGSLDAQLSAEASADHPLRLLGRHPRPAELLAGADALVMPSRLEGAPLAFLEAATHHLPVVASHEALEALGSGAARLAALADPEDVAEMADALAGCLDPAGPARTRAEAAWRFATAWGGTAMAEAYLARLRRLPAGSLGVAGGG